MTARIAVYLTVAAVVLVALLGWQEREDGRTEERERLAVAHAVRWHQGYIVARDSTRKLARVAASAVAKSEALRDSVRIVNDTTLVVDTLTVPVPQVVVRRLVADSVTIARLTALTNGQNVALAAGDSTIAAYQAALHAAQQAGKCRIAKVLPCPSRKSTALLTAGTLLVAKVYLGGI